MPVPVPVFPQSRAPAAVSSYITSRSTAPGQTLEFFSAMVGMPGGVSDTPREKMFVLVTSTSTVTVTIIHVLAASTVIVSDTEIPSGTLRLTPVFVNVITLPWAATWRGRSRRAKKRTVVQKEMMTDFMLCTLYLEGKLCAIMLFILEVAIVQLV